jgi:hypothetical protein
MNIVTFVKAFVNASQSQEDEVKLHFILLKFHGTINSH